MVGSMAPPFSSGHCAITRRRDRGNGCRFVRDARSCPRTLGRVLVTRHRCVVTATPGTGTEASDQVGTGVNVSEKFGECFVVGRSYPRRRFRGAARPAVVDA